MEACTQTILKNLKNNLHNIKDMEINSNLKTPQKEDSFKIQIIGKCKITAQLIQAMELQTCEETIKINRRIYMSQVQEIY
jgi:hypothetical protein